MLLEAIQIVQTEMYAYKQTIFVSDRRPHLFVRFVHLEWMQLGETKYLNIWIKQTTDKWGWEK